MVERPVVNRLRSRQMEIIRRWMDLDPGVRYKYSDAFFSLSNVAELQEGEYDCVHRFRTIENRRAFEAGMPDKELLEQLDKEVSATSDIELQKVYYRETLVRGLIISRYLMRMGSAKDTVHCRKALNQALAETDPRVERELLRFSVEEFFTHMRPEFLPEFHRELLERFGTDYTAMADWLWDSSCVSTGSLNIKEDPLYRYVRDLSIVTLNEAENHVADPLELHRDYVRARYRHLSALGIPQYPDANSTMRLTYGRVQPMKPWDGVYTHWQSTAAGLRQKYSVSNYDFHYPDAFRDALPPADFPVNFLTDLDITGGNSGSPVLNARGELIGLAFDGNKESLASNFESVPGYNMCVCVDIRYVLWILEHYAHQDYVLQELGII